MNNQLTLSGFSSPEDNESVFLDTVFDQLQMAVEESGGDKKLLTRKATKAKSKASGYTAVLFHKLTAFRIKFRGKQHYLSIPISFADLIPEEYPTKKMESDPKYIRVLVDDDHPAEMYAPFLTKIAGECANRYPKEWDCCSRYMECSDAKCCVHPDKVFALACGYRRILSSGRVFYGQNRNID